MFDCHCHLDDPRFDSDRTDVVARAHAAGIDAIALPGIEPAQWSRASALRDSLAATMTTAVAGVGYHPWFLPAGGEPTPAMEALRESARDLGAAFVGECGLDALRGDLAEQAPWFEAQIDAAITLGLPLVLHVVKAHDQALAILERSGAKGVGGLVHGFSGGAQHIRHYIDLGFAISLGGAVTWPNARRAVAAAQAVPADWLLVETDAPDQPALRRPRGEPADLVEIIEVVAAIRGDSPVEVATRSAANAARILRLPDREQMI